MLQPLTRRRALQLGGLGVAGVLVGGGGLTAASTLGTGNPDSGQLTAPADLTSTNGSLDLTLNAARVRAPLSGRDATTLRYNGGLPGPTLHLSPGDHLGIDLVNNLAEPTNLHTHGLQVSPQGNSDNPFVMLEPGQTFHYDYRIPADHPGGTFWYHPHVHGRTADQVFGGLYGAIIIGEAAPPDVSGDRTLIISDITLDDSGDVAAATAMDRMQGREGRLVLLNGKLAPQLTVPPGARERWRIVNACVSRYLRLRLDGQQLQLLGIDLLQGCGDQIITELVLEPGNRADLLVTTTAGTAVLQTLPYDRGTNMGMGGGMGSVSTSGDVIDLLTLTVGGDPVLSTAATIPRFAATSDLRSAGEVHHRALTLAMGMGMGMSGSATIDGQVFDAARIDQTVSAGAVEEWTITNTSPLDHPFHLHVWPMQIISIGGRTADEPQWRNVVDIPAHSNVVVRIAFGPQTGKTVYHCHILDHEDSGMMGTVQVG